MSNSNDLASILVGVRLMHRVKAGWIPVTICGVTPNRYAYQHDGNGRVFSCTVARMRCPSRFRHLDPRERAATVEATPLAVRHVEPLRPGLVDLRAVAAPPPIAMADENGDIAIAGHVIHGYVFGGAVVVIAGDLDAPLGYAPKGIAQLIGGEWKNEVLSPVHFRVLRGDDLRAFKATVALGGSVPPGANVGALTILTEAGVDRVTLLTKKKAGIEARAFTADEVFPKLRRGEPVAPVAALAPAPVLPPGPSSDVLELKGMVQAMLGAVTGLVQVVNATLRPGLPTASPMPAPEFPVPADWITHADMAKKLPATEGQIATLIRLADTIRGNTDLCRKKLCDRRDGSRHSVYFYDPCVLDMVRRMVKGTVASMHQVENGLVSPVGTDIQYNGRPVDRPARPDAQPRRPRGVEQTAGPRGSRREREAPPMTPSQVDVAPRSP